MELLYEKRRNTLFNVVYRPTNDKIEPFEKKLKTLFDKIKTPIKVIILQGTSILTS